MANSDIIKIGFDYRASLAQFEKDTNGVFDGISTKAGKQKITIQLDAKDDKVIDKIKELQKLKLDKFTFEFGSSGLKEQLQTFDKLENKINEIINLGKGRSFIDSSSTVSDIGKIENKINELNKKYEETQKKLSSIGSGNVSGKDINLVDNAEFQKLSDSFEKIKGEVDDLKTHMNLLDDSVVSGEQFIKLGEQVEGLSVKFDTLIDKYVELSNVQRALSSTPQESNISSGSNPAIEQQNKLQEELKETQTEIVETRSKYQSLLDVAKKQLDDDKGTNYYSGKTTETKAFDNFTFNEQAKRSSHFDVWSKDYEELCSLIDKTEEELESGSIGFDDAIDRMVSAYQKYDTATKIDVGGFDFLDGVENVPSVLSDTEKAVLNENKAIKESEYTLQDYINTYLELKKVKESSLSVNPKITGVTSNGRPIIKDGSDESFKAELMMKDMESEVLQIYGKDLSALADEHIKASESAKEHAKAENQVTQAVKEVSSTASQDQKKDAFPKTSENLEQVAKSEQKVQQEAVATDKALDNISFIPNTEGFDEVLSKLDLTKSKLSEITKISIQGHRNADGKFDTSYILRDKNGSTETYGESSKSEKGQLLTHHYVQYDANAQLRQEQQETKRIIEENIRLNKNYYDSKAKDEAEYQKLREKYIAEGLRQEQQVHQEYNKSWEEAINYNNSLDNSLKNTETVLDGLATPKTLENDFLKLIDDSTILEHRLKNCEITLKEYNSLINSKVGDYNKKVSIQENRDLESYNAQVNEKNTKKLEREKQIWNELTTSLDRYATLQKRIASNNVLSTDNEEATKLLEHIHELQRNDILPTEKLTASNEKLQQINQTVTDLKAKLKESTLDSLQGSIDKYQKIYDQRSTYSSDFTPSEQYTKNLTGLDTAIKNLVEYRNTLKNVSEVTAEQEAKLKRMVAACEKASDSFKSLSASEKGASQIAIDKLVQRINKDLDECTNYSKKAKLGLRALRDELESANPRNLKEITSEIINIENAEIRAGRAGRSFFDTLKNSGFHQIAAQMAGMVGVYDVINGLKQVASTIRELDTAYTEMRKVSDESAQSLKNFQKESFSTADSVGTTALAMQDATATWMRLGESLDDAKESAKDATVLLNVSEFDNIDEATDSLVAMSQAYKELDKMEIIDVLDKIGNEYSISTDELSTALKDSAAVLKTQGNDLAESVALITAGNAITQDASKTAGETLPERYRNIFYRTYLTARAA